jgi:hypothetical protein
MSDQTLPPSFGVQMFAEAPQQVRAQVVGDQAVVTFGDDLNGVRLMGDAGQVHLLVVEADRQLTLLRDGGQA